MSSDTPEPLAAILAEMRDGIHTGRADIIDCVNDVLYRYADRVEAAAKREQQDAMKTAFLTKCKVCEKVGPAAAPGNAAAMRGALDKAECVLLVAARFATDNAFTDAEARENLRDVDWDGALTEINAALAAPARNCDRFATAEEAVAAFADHLRAWENAHGICSEYPDHAVQVPAGAFAWLFGKAEGGAE